MKSGIRQGSVLEPILFVIFINDMLDIVRYICQLFADNAKVFCNAATQWSSQHLRPLLILSLFPEPDRLNLRSVDGWNGQTWRMHFQSWTQLTQPGLAETHSNAWLERVWQEYGALHDQADDIISANAAELTPPSHNSKQKLFIATKQLPSLQSYTGEKICSL